MSMLNMLIDYKIHHNFFFACVDVKLIKLLMVVFFLISLLFLLVLFFILCMLASRVSLHTSTNLFLVLVSFPTSGFFLRLLRFTFSHNIGLLHPHLKSSDILELFVPICSYNSYAVHSNSMQLFHILTSERLPSLSSCPFLPDSEPDSDSSPIPANATFL